MYNEPVVGSGAEAQGNCAVVINSADTCVTVSHWIPILENGENVEFMNGWISTVFKHGLEGKVMT